VTVIDRKRQKIKWWIEMKNYIEIDRKSDNCRYSERLKDSVDLEVISDFARISKTQLRQTKKSVEVNVPLILSSFYMLIATVA
jgi:hypothetical protein